MKISLSALLLLITLCLVVAFTSGYMVGSRDVHGVKNVSTIGKTTPPPLNITKTEHKTDDAKDLSEKNEGHDIQHTNLESIDAVNSENVFLQIDGLTLTDSAGVSQIVEFLAAINTSENEADFEKFAPALKKLHAVIKNNPYNYQILIDYFADTTFTDNPPYYLTSALNNAEIEDKDVLLHDLVLRLSTQGTNEGNTRLLHLVSSADMHFENEQVINSIKNIALYSQAGSTNRTFALDLLMPYQLNESEKNKVVTDLSYALDQAAEGEVSYMVENIIRFSDKSQRIELAQNYLQQTNSFETRIALLSTLHTGTIKPNDALKEVLFSIAENTADPLNTHARDTLMYVFEINNIEYQRLQNDK